MMFFCTICNVVMYESSVKKKITRCPIMSKLMLHADYCHNINILSLGQCYNTKAKIPVNSVPNSYSAYKLTGSRH